MLLITAIILIIVFLFSFWLDERTMTRPHAEMVKETLQEELKQIQAEKLSTPGGKYEVWKSPQPLECCGKDITECECLRE